MRIFASCAEVDNDTACEVCGLPYGEHLAQNLACPFRWVIEVTVSHYSVADGLDFERVTPKTALLRAFPWANGIEARVLEAPDPALIREAQGHPSKESQ
jgi:hypothetical protein